MGRAVGATARVLELWRNRRQEMRFSLEPREVRFIYRMLFNPYEFPLNAVEGGLKPYRPTGSPKDVMRTGKMIAGLKKNWFNAKIVEGTEEKDGLTFHKFHKENVETSLTQVYLDLLVQIAEYYQPIGVLAETVDVYVPLLAKLKGENYVEDEFLDEPAPEKGAAKASA